MEGNLRLFEIGTVFQSATGNQQPREEVRVGALCMGARRPPHFTEPDPPAWDAWDAKALAESVAGAVWPGQAISLVPGGTERTPLACQSRRRNGRPRLASVAQCSTVGVTRVWN